jgi:cytoskeletal protein RodZ
MMKQVKLRPDAISFLGKEALLKPENAGFINETNYEEFFLLYVDGELTAAERREVESFAATKPQFQQELNLLLQTKVEPAHEVVFPDKSLLYKEEKKRPVIVIGWQRIVAVAAMLVLALGIFWLSGNNTGTEKPDTVVKTETGQQQQGNDANANDATGANNATKVNDPNSIAATKEQQSNGPGVKSQFADANSPAPQNQVVVQTKQDKANRQVDANNRKYDAAVKNDQQLAYEPNKVNTVTDADEGTGKALATVEVAGIERNSANNVSTALQTANVNSGVRALGQAVRTVAYIEEDDNVYIANTTVDRKNKLRGLFRKVTRVFEKTTNLPAVEEKGILIGNLEIALK